MSGICVGRCVYVKYKPLPVPGIWCNLQKGKEDVLMLGNTLAPLESATKKALEAPRQESAEAVCVITGVMLSRAGF